MIELINRLIFNLGGSREVYDSSEQIGKDVWLVHFTLTVSSGVQSTSRSYNPLFISICRVQRSCSAIKGVAYPSSPCIVPLIFLLEARIVRSPRDWFLDG